MDNKYKVLNEHWLYIYSPKEATYTFVKTTSIEEFADAWEKFEIEEAQWYEANKKLIEQYNSLLK